MISCESKNCRYATTDHSDQIVHDIRLEMYLAVFYIKYSIDIVYIIGEGIDYCWEFQLLLNIFINLFFIHIPLYFHVRFALS